MLYTLAAHSHSYSRPVQFLLDPFQCNRALPGSDDDQVTKYGKASCHQKWRLSLSPDSRLQWAPIFCQGLSTMEATAEDCATAIFQTWSGGAVCCGTPRNDLRGHRAYVCLTPLGNLLLLRRSTHQSMPGPCFDCIYSPSDLHCITSGRLSVAKRRAMSWALYVFLGSEILNSASSTQGIDTWLPQFRWPILNLRTSTEDLICAQR